MTPDIIFLSAILLPPLIFYIFITIMARKIDPAGEKLTEPLPTKIIWHVRAYLSYTLYHLIYITLVIPTYIYKEIARRGEGKKHKEKKRVKKTVILIHGFLSTPTHWLIFRKRLEKLIGKGGDTRITTFSYNSIAGSLEKWSDDLEKKARSLNTDEVIFAGHSLGGLISIWTASNISKSADKIPIKVVTFGTPFYGTEMAKFSISPNGRKLQPDTPYMNKSVAILEEGNIDLTGYWSKFDRIIIPHSSAKPKNSKSIELKGISHTGYFFINPDIPELTS